MPLARNDIEGTLTIDGVSMNPSNGAWGVIGDERGNGGLLPLWADFDVRGDDRVLPGTAGVIAYPRRITVTRHDLRLLVVGDVLGETGVPQSDSRVGLAANIEYLRTNVIAPVASTDGTRAATLTVFGLSSRSADIHVEKVVTQTYHLDECASLWVATLQISIPSGRLS